MVEERFEECLEGYALFNEKGQAWEIQSQLFAFYHSCGRPLNEHPIKQALPSQIQSVWTFFPFYEVPFCVKKCLEYSAHYRLRLWSKRIWNHVTHFCFLIGQLRQCFVSFRKKLEHAIFSYTRAIKLLKNNGMDSWVLTHEFWLMSQTQEKTHCVN